MLHPTTEAGKAVIRTAVTLTIEAHKSFLVHPEFASTSFHPLVESEKKMGRSVILNMNNVRSESPAKIISERNTPLSLGFALLPPETELAQALFGEIIARPVHIGTIADAVFVTLFAGLTGFFHRRQCALCTLYKIEEGGELECIWAEQISQTSLYICSTKVLPSFTLSKPYFIVCR